MLVPLAALAEIAPPIVTREEVNWRNRNSDFLFEGEVAWEDVPFLPPVLNRIRSTTGRRKRQQEGETGGPALLGREGGAFSSRRKNGKGSAAGDFAIETTAMERPRPASDRGGTLLAGAREMWA